MRARLQRFMIGRYGSDGLNKFLSIAALACLVLSLVLNLFGANIFVSILYALGLGLLVYSYFRMLSRNTQKRYAENLAYYNMANRWKNKWKTQRVHFAQRKLYHFYKCPSCRQALRVPRGRGRIEITCPKCHTNFVKKS